jgi:putative inorganic carbon (hco3(-)) transporter
MTQEIWEDRLQKSQPKVASQPRIPVARVYERSEFGYWVMVVFSFLYYFRPGDTIRGVAVLHPARITAVFAVMALLMGANKIRLKQLPAEIKIIFAMFGWMVLTIPFASWRGGSFQQVFFEFSKALIVTLTLIVTVTRKVELRRLMLVQALGVALMTSAAVIANNRMQGRLAGVGDAMLSNPNDLAINVALNWPLCLLFLITVRGMAAKLFWAVSMLVMIYALIETYSRAGFLALIVAIVLCLWEFGIRRKKVYVLGVAFVCLMATVAVAPGNYIARLETLLGKFQEGDYDRGSAEARYELLIQSLKVTATHPVFGVGPGNFPSYTGLWRVTHNTYTQFSSECGIPVLLLFLLLLWRVFLNLRYLRKVPRSTDTEELHLYTSALMASFGAYLLGAFFSRTGYELFPYYMVVYTTLLYRLTLAEQERKTTSLVRTPIEFRPRAYTPA